MHITLHGSRRATQRVCVRASFHLHVIHDVCLSVRWLLSSCLSFSCFSLLFTSSLPHSTCTLTSTSSPMSTASREFTTAPSHNKEYCAMAIYHPPQVMSPTSLTTSTTQRLLRRRDHRKSVIFTTVHSGARRTSGPETSLSLSRRKFVASSVLFRTLKNGETRART